MATLIPDSLPAESTHGEKQMARLLQRLPEDWIVYYEPIVKGLKPDFVILAPEHGVLVLEIKDWQIGTVLSVDPAKILLQIPGSSVKKVVFNPLSQVRRYWQAVINEC